MRALADNANRQSVASELRRKRFQLFLDMLDAHPSGASILDVGGTEQFWELALSGTDYLGRIHVTLLNRRPQQTTDANFTYVGGDARAMPQFADNQFDFVFSNSTIEHVGNWVDQQRMAEEVQRVGKNCYVQTPNRYFPIEPHFVFPFFQFLPQALQVWLVQRYSLGWFPVIHDHAAAVAEVSEIQLLSRREFARLFAGAKIHSERYYGLTKSFVAIQQTN